MKPCFVIAEAGVNHNGDIGLAKELITAAKECGADAVKFQTFSAEKLVNKTASKANYQKSATGQGTQFEMLKKLELSKESHHILAEQARSLGIEFMSTGFDEEAVDFLIELGVQRIKIPSGEVTNVPLLHHIAQKQLPMILSTGMCDLEEVQEAINVIQTITNAELTLLHCTSNYPAAFEDVNLRAMQTLAKTFNLPVGYSDHTLGCLVPTLAIAMGATIIEKHFTLDKSLEGPDHLASLDVPELTHMMKLIRESEACLGDGVKAPRQNELPIRELVRRSITLCRDVKKGQPLSREDFMLLRPGMGIAPKHFSDVVGKIINVDLEIGTTLQWEHLQNV
jgi:N,N'-diacetyllegionaminate synthase